jgi:hypothetical protein
MYIYNRNTYLHVHLQQNIGPSYRETKNIRKLMLKFIEALATQKGAFYVPKNGVASWIQSCDRYLPTLTTTHNNSVVVRFRCYVNYYNTGVVTSKLTTTYNGSRVKRFFEF